MKTRYPIPLTSTVMWPGHFDFSMPWILAIMETFGLGSGFRTEGPVGKDFSFPCRPFAFFLQPFARKLRSQDGFFLRVGVADRNGEGIGGILGEDFAQAQDCLHHHLYLLLLGPAVTDDGLLDLER